MSQPRIFVSYSRKDQAFTQRLVDDLHAAGAEAVEAEERAKELGG